MGSFLRNFRNNAVSFNRSNFFPPRHQPGIRKRKSVRVCVENKKKTVSWSLTRLTNSLHQNSSAPSSGSSPAKKETQPSPMNALEKKLQGMGPIREDGSDKFFGMENVSYTDDCIGAIVLFILTMRSFNSTVALATAIRSCNAYTSPFLFAKRS